MNVSYPETIVLAQPIRKKTGCAEVYSLGRMPIMKALFQRSLSLLTALCCFALPAAVLSSFDAAASSSQSTTGPAKRWARFELSQAGSTGDIQIGKMLTMDIALGGVTQGTVPVVAICESIHFESQTITLEPDEDSMTLRATVTLEPMPMSRTSVHPKAARIQVTFARFRQDKFERFMRRIVYITLDRQEPPADNSDALPLRPEEPAVTELVADESQPDALPISGEALAEEDLMPLADPGQGRAYWQQVSQLVSRSWARQVRGIRRGPSSETVKVHFQLFPNGRAQLIEIEKGSGAREIDEAGIYAVVNAQPFPPFPEELGDEAMDVHVRMRTGARPRPREVQSVTSQSNGKPDAPSTKK
ncbi:MAG: TonB family protein [Nitrospira sp. CR1.3]|nr:TonB family protein [Nitrospira sp. CR1.3]